MSELQCACPSDKHEEWCANHPARRTAEPDGKPNAERYPSGLRCDCPPGKHAAYCANGRMLGANVAPDKAPEPGKPSQEAPLTKADVAATVEETVKKTLAEVLGAKPS